MKGLVLFDIDNTLLKPSEVHAAAFSHGFNETYAVDTSIKIINCHGMTDQQIIIDVLKKNGLTQEEIIPKINDCMKQMINYFDNHKDSSEITVLAGVPELLEALSNQQFLIGLVTGNVEAIARSKMKKVNLNKYFKLGGFGSDNVNRTKLVELAIKKAEENFDFKYNKNVFLFGDTPRDIQAAVEAGIVSIGVATGMYDKKELKHATADYVVDNLQDTKKLLCIVTKESSR